MEQNRRQFMFTNLVAATTAALSGMFGMLRPMIGLSSNSNSNVEAATEWHNIDLSKPSGVMMRGRYDIAPADTHIHFTHESMADPQKRGRMLEMLADPANSNHQMTNVRNLVEFTKNPDVPVEIRKEIGERVADFLNSEVCTIKSGDKHSFKTDIKNNIGHLPIGMFMPDDYVESDTANLKALKEAATKRENYQVKLKS